MKKMVLVSLASALMLVTAPAFAGLDDVQERPRRDVPELDALGAPVALALIAGVAGIALERRRRNKK